MQSRKPHPSKGTACEMISILRRGSSLHYVLIVASFPGQAFHMQQKLASSPEASSKLEAGKVQLLSKGCLFNYAFVPTHCVRVWLHKTKTKGTAGLHKVHDRRHETIHFKQRSCDVEKERHGTCNITKSKVVICMVYTDKVKLIFLSFNLARRSNLPYLTQLSHYSLYVH